MQISVYKGSRAHVGHQRYREHPPPSIEDRWEERWLFFWTIRQVLATIALAALTVYFVVVLIEGRLLPDELLRYGTGWPSSLFG